MDYRYIRGSSTNREAVEFDIVHCGRRITTCTVNVDLLLCGIKCFSCGNGADVTLTAQQCLKILELVQTERSKITTGVAIKTLESWNQSGLDFEEYFFPGDTVSKDVVDNLVHSVPPVLMLSFCTQTGEVFSREPDDSGTYRPTFSTFHQTGEDLWQFDGYCFFKENVNRVEVPFKQARFKRRIEEIRKAAK